MTLDNNVIYGGKAWTNDEINRRINMLQEMVEKFRDTDQMNVLNLQREIASWRELIARRMT